MTYNHNDVESVPLTPQLSCSTLVEMNQFVEKSIVRFWKLWIGEYLGSLREQHSYVKNKNHLKKDMICIGDIVLVSDNTPQTKWKYGIIEELIRGKDRKIWGACLFLKK